MRDLANDLKEAAEQVEAAHPGAHVIVVAIDGGMVSVYAKSPIINDKLDCAAALKWVANETAKVTYRGMAARLAPPPCVPGPYSGT